MPTKTKRTEYMREYMRRYRNSGTQAERIAKLEEAVEELRRDIDTIEKTIAEGTPVE